MALERPTITSIVSSLILSKNSPTTENKYTHLNVSIDFNKNKIINTINYYKIYAY